MLITILCIHNINPLKVKATISSMKLKANAHLRGKIELAKIGERSEQNSQLYFVPL
jgi:hypothetical protein